jgi:hypothetical protein
MTMAINAFAPFGGARPLDAAFLRSSDTAIELFELIDELSRKARLLQAARADVLCPAPMKPEAAAFVATEPRRLIRERKRRKKLFPPDLFADPAWDIMLNLYAAQIEQRRETITGVIISADIPATTGLRWVHKLVEENMLMLRDDPLDARRRFVHLSPRALAMFDDYFSM